jgi:hypothetical protein
MTPSWGGYIRPMFGFTVIIAAWLFSLNPAGAYDSSGVDLKIYAQQGQSSLQFNLGTDAVPLIIVLSNIAGRTVYTERGFSQIELHQTLIVTAPDGSRFPVRAADDGHKMPVPFFLNEKAYGLAEPLAPDWSRSATISDLRELLPAMKTVPGWYTIDAEQPFVRFAATADIKGLGFLGQQENPSNWHGTIASNKLQVYIKPPGGGQPEIRVQDASTDPAKPLFQVPVRVFKKADLPPRNSLEQSWNAAQPALAGTTDSRGIAKWTSKEPCLTQADYTVIAKYGERFGDTSFQSGAAGWTAGACSGLLEGTISIAALPPPVQPVITVKGNGSIYPVPNYRATFSMDATTAGGAPSGWFKYSYTKTRMSFVSTGIAEVTAFGASAKIKGTGTVNGKAGYTFEADVVDGSPDQLGVVIRNPDGTTLDIAAPKELIAGGLTVIME